MSLDVQLGGVVLPLDPDLVEQNRIREAADPLLVRLLDFLSAVLTSELTAAFEELPGLPSHLKKVLVKSIPADPLRFLTTISKDDFPLLCVYRTQRTWVPWTIDRRKRECLWNADYVLPELDQFQLGSMLGFENAVDAAMAQALAIGFHSAYNSGASVLSGMNVELLEPTESVSSNWTVVDEKNQSINYPALRLQFRTIELPTDNVNGDNLVPLENIGIRQDLDTEGAADVDGFVVSEIEDLDA